MKSYKGITRANNPDWNGWGYIALYSCLCKDGDYETFFEEDKPLQDLVKKHYQKQQLLIILFNLSPYILVYSIISLI